MRRTGHAVVDGMKPKKCSRIYAVDHLITTSLGAVLVGVPVLAFRLKCESKHRTSTVFRLGEAADPVRTARLLETP